MRILQLVHAIDRDQLGGLERYVGELGNTLAARGHDVTVATKRLSQDLSPSEILPSGVRLVRLDVPPRSARAYAIGYPLESVLRTSRFVRRDDYDVVHAHFMFQGFACRLVGSPYLYTFHASASSEAIDERANRYAWPGALDGVSHTVLRRLERAAVRGATKRIVLSNSARRELDHLAPGCGPTHLIPGGVDTTFFSPGTPVGSSDEWSGRDGAVLFCAQRLTPNKGVQNLIAAIPKISEAAPGVRVAIAGTGFLRERLAHRVAAAGLGSQVRFLGRLTSMEMRDWYRRATLCVTATVEREGFGLCTAESLACATPVVGTPVGATPELLGPLDSRLIAPDSSPEGLASAITAALAREAELPELGRRARQLAVRNWSWENVVRAHEPIYGVVQGAMTTRRRAA